MPIILSWDDNLTRCGWSPTLIQQVTLSFDDLELGQPEQFLPGYNSLIPENKIRFWAELVIAIIRYESNFDPKCVYHEPARIGVDSIGLLQLSYQDQDNYEMEDISENDKSLENPLVNIRCGLVILAHWLSADGTVAQGRKESSRGAARYWSVVREGIKHHKEEIRLHVKTELKIK
jgi:hypothetical protein